ncbi:MoaD/ThiS family protein [Nguyenibacter vanlangensis]|uniref:Molybdopterin synthase sulfur carrier subunit n=1 Tax=Nguyenibacter vanlangensis TaxID=1216886 RepID=A0A7Y7ITW4_9PROT|nr:MoaD/ThiS family protein [Nguyenibacter vanlangensis]NVN10289.1 MoaD/ThiS family protein [Nguyenibacter vanlangensis]
MVTILYFAWLRDRLGRSTDSLAIPAQGCSVRDVMQALGQRDAALGALFGPASVPSGAGAIRCAVNQEFAGPDDPVRPGDELAFFPPVTGG